MTEEGPDDIVGISVSEMVRIHERMISELGGEPGILYKGNLEFIVAMMDERYIRRFDLLTLAAKIMNGIIRGHPFVDGNKRTGYETTDTFLRRNGIRIVCTPEEGVDLTLAIARCEMSDERIRDWLMIHTKYLNKEFP